MLDLHSLLEVKNIPVHLVPNHASIHLWVHHLNGRHRLEKTKPVNTMSIQMALRAYFTHENVLPRKRSLTSMGGH